MTMPACLSASGCPILQVAQAGISRASWASTRGLTPRDLAMHVVLPEVDGRIFANAIAVQGAWRQRRPALAPTTLPAGSRIGLMRPRIWRAPGSRLRPRAERQRRVALILRRIIPTAMDASPMASGLDTPQSLIDVLAAMRGEAGYWHW